MTTDAQNRVSGSGLAFAVAAYLLWGVLPVLFFALRASGALEIVAWRIVLSLIFCGLAVAVAFRSGVFNIGVEGGYRFELGTRPELHE